MSEVMTGMERSIYLSNKEIIKPSPAEKPQIKTEALIKEKFLSDRGKTQPNSGSKRKTCQKKWIPTKVKKQVVIRWIRKNLLLLLKNREERKSDHRKMLPNTGEKNGIATLLGFLLLLVFPFLRKRVEKMHKVQFVAILRGKIEQFFDNRVSVNK